MREAIGADDSTRVYDPRKDDLSSAIKVLNRVTKYYRAFAMMQFIG